jgi:uncharacterized repeat protein (TIGR01451 family)
MKTREGNGVLKGWVVVFALALGLIPATARLLDSYALAGQENSNQATPDTKRPKRVTPKGNQSTGQEDTQTPDNRQSNSNTQQPRAYRVGAPKPDVQMKKIMLMDGKELPPEHVEPIGAEITYTTLFTNRGTAPSHNPSIIDPIQDRTDFKLGSVVPDLGTTGLRVTVSYSKDDGENCDYTPVSGGGGAPEGFDRLVNAVCLSFSGDLGYTAPDNAAGFSYVGRRR